MRVRRKRLGDLLLEANVITEEQLKQAISQQKESKLRLGEQLVTLGYLTEHQLIEVLELQLNIPRVQILQHGVEQNILNMISEELCRRYNVLPLKKQGSKLILAMSDPLDYYAIDELRLSTGFQIEPVLTEKAELDLAINRYYGMQRSIEEMMSEISVEDGQDVTELMAESQDESPAAKMVSQIIHQAVQLGASDIHMDPMEDETKIRLRVDGSLRTERTLPRHMHAILSSRIKIMTRLNIAERRLPQDGRFQIEIKFRKIDIRVSVLPTLFGEKIVLRILDLSSIQVDVHNLQFSKENEAKFTQMIGQAYGIVLVTGPTGSGKTTTLYTALHQLNQEDVNIITVEDPVEYQIKGINQVQLNPQVGMGFSNGLRSILRQDPNIIMVGEIRDYETAEIALRAAMTGHLVLSTLHTNDAVSTVTRLIDMGIQPFLISSSLVGVIAQRLVRKVCPLCAEAYSLPEEERQLFLKKGLSDHLVRKGKGCPACQQTGYKGRMAIQEVLQMDDQLREMVAQQQTDGAYRHWLQQKGHQSLFDDGLAKVAQGLTTLEEVYRVSIDYEE